MRFAIYEHDAVPGVDAVVERKSYAYCQSLVDAGTHCWLEPRRAGVQAVPPVKEADELLTIPQEGSLDFADSINNGSGSADKKRAALRDSGRLDAVEIAAMQKVRNYYERDKKTGRMLPSWADCIVAVDKIELRLIRHFA